jgi:hypothetical protein
MNNRHNCRPLRGLGRRHNGKILRSSFGELELRRLRELFRLKMHNGHDQLWIDDWRGRGSGLGYLDDIGQRHK